MISFDRRIRKSGDSLVFTIPSEMAKHEKLKAGSRVWVILRKFGAVRVKTVKRKKKLIKED